MQKRIRPNFQALPDKFVNWNGQSGGQSPFGSRTDGNNGFTSSSSPMGIPFHKNNHARFNQNQNRQPLKPIVPGEKPSRPKQTANCVTFQRETDGRSNFPNQRDFQDFCKQRDLFYAIKEIWTSKGQTPQVVQQFPQNDKYHNQTYDPASSKMRALFQMNSNPTNLSRLAALFLSQCVLDSAYSNTTDTVGEIGIAESNVRRILQSNPSKLEQLKQRVAPPEAAVDFVQISDPMAFLKYFINSPHVPSSFQQYLMDRAVHEISEVELAADQDVSDQKDMLDLMKKSRLLAKMLGYIYFAPYRQEGRQIGKINSECVQNQASLRAYQSPPLDFFSILQKAFLENRLVFTLPWILEFLSQADPSTFFLKSYNTVLSLISIIYRDNLSANSKTSTTTSSANNLATENRKYLRLYCETLFSQEGIESFFKKQEFNLAEFTSSADNKPETSESETMDSKEFIGATLNPICFQKQIQKEMVDEFPSLETTSTSSKRCPSPFPDRVMKTTSPLPNPKPNIQQELEAQFFKLHSPSVKKTVDFIAERVASNFVKKLRNLILLELKKCTVEKSIFEDEAVLWCKEEIDRQRKEFCEEKCTAAILLLMESGTNEQITSTCSAIGQRKTEEKITEWVTKHVTKDLFPKIGKLPEPIPTLTQEEVANTESKSNEPELPMDNITTPPALETKLVEHGQEIQDLTMKTEEEEFQPELFQIMRLLHDCTRKIFNGERITPSNIEDILNTKLFEQKPWIANATINFAIELATFQPSALTDAVLQKFTYFWSQFPDTELNVFCARNLRIIGLSPNAFQTWSSVALILKSLMRSEVIDCTDWEEQCDVLAKEGKGNELSNHILFLKSLVLTK